MTLLLNVQDVKGEEQRNTNPGRALEKSILQPRFDSTGLTLKASVSVSLLN
jgi:hypothetical protein